MIWNVEVEAYNLLTEYWESHVTRDLVMVLGYWWIAVCFGIGSSSTVAFGIG